MRDIVERLRSFHGGGPPLWAETMHEAASEIERLRRVHNTNVLGYEAEIAALKRRENMSDPHPEWTRQRERDPLIEQQRAEIERLEVALQEIWSTAPNIAIAQDIARAALEGK